MKNWIKGKKSLLTLFSLSIITVVLNNLIFSNQLNYGFRDVDWQVLYYFKLFGNLSLNHLSQEFGILGVYLTESYYVGLLQNFLGLNFTYLHQVSHILKIVSAISVFLLTLKIFDNKLLAFISSLIYTISYTHAGPLFQLATGGYFLAVIFMNAFLITYYHTITKKNILKWAIISDILLIVSFLLKPERMYPLIFMVIIVEVFIFILSKFRKESLNISLRRILIILLPTIILFLLYHILLSQRINPGFGTNQFILGTQLKVSSILNGNWQLLLYPFASLGSIFFYGDYWEYFGQLNFQNIESYISSLILNPILKLGLVSFIIFSLISKKPLKHILFITLSIFVFGLIIFGINTHWQQFITPTRIHFDPNLIAMPAIFGFYILMLSFLFFVKWIKNRDLLLAPPILGFSFAFFLILMTWIPADLHLAFMGPQRYLSIPSIGTSLFISGFLLIFFNRLRKIKMIHQFAWIIFLILIPLIIINYRVANDFFNYELTYAGLNGGDQTRMKDKFRNIAGDINNEERSLFYFDETADKENGYFDESTIMAGFEYWVRLNREGEMNNFPEPGMVRTNLQCPEHSHKSCIELLKTGLTEENSKKGVLYKDPIRGQNSPRFYKLSNFYAFRFINKDLMDIKDEVLKELELTNPH